MRSAERFRPPWYRLPFTYFGAFILFAALTPLAPTLVVRAALISVPLLVEFWLVYRIAIEVDELTVTLHGPFRKQAVVERDDLISLELLESGFRFRTRKGLTPTYSPLWPPSALSQIARRLGLPVERVTERPRRSTWWERRVGAFRRRR